MSSYSHLGVKLCSLLRDHWTLQSHSTPKLKRLVSLFCTLDACPSLTSAPRHGSGGILAKQPLRSKVTGKAWFVILAVVNIWLLVGLNGKASCPWTHVNTFIRTDRSFSCSIHFPQVILGDDCLSESSFILLLGLWFLFKRYGHKQRNGKITYIR